MIHVQHQKSNKMKILGMGETRAVVYPDSDNNDNSNDIHEVNNTHVEGWKVTQSKIILKMHKG